MIKIAVLGGTGYLATLIKNQNNIRKNKYFFFSRKKSVKSHIINISFKNNLKILKNYDVILHLSGPNQNQLKKNKSLLKKKNQITANICDLCLDYNIKLLYLSSMQVYKDYGKNNISINSKINKKNLYSMSHYMSEKIIIKKFLNHKKMFTILRMGNVFGFKKFESIKKLNDNLIHSLCILGIKKKKLFIKNPNIQRTLIPSQIFVKVINFIINKNLFKNSIVNISYINLSVKEISQIIKKRTKLLFNISIDIVLQKISHDKKFYIKSNQNFKFNPVYKKIYLEIDQIIKFIKRNF